MQKLEKSSLAWHPFATRAFVVASLVGLSLAGCALAGTPGTAPSSEGSPTSQSQAAPETPRAIPQVDPTILETYGSLGQLDEFEATTIDGKTFLPEDMAKKDVTVINFWQTTCPPCIKEMPALQALSEQLPDNIQILTYCFDAPFKTETAQSILENAGWNGVTLASSTGSLDELTYLIRYTPTTIFFAADGTVVGSMLVGSPVNLEEAYLENINAVLACEGLDPVVLNSGNADK